MGNQWKVRGVRGATTVNENSQQAIVESTHELVDEIIRRNDIDIDDIASVIFTTTQDLNAAFPAVGGRQAGLSSVPLMCATEIDVPGGQPRCIRVLMHVNTTKAQNEMKHVYLRDAIRLRPDLEGND